jgi:hypothetical protein
LPPTVGGGLSCANAAPEDSTRTSARIFLMSLHFGFSVDARQRKS